MRKPKIACYRYRNRYDVSVNPVSFSADVLQSIAEAFPDQTILVRIESEEPDIQRVWATGKSIGIKAVMPRSRESEFLAVCSKEELQGLLSRICIDGLEDLYMAGINPDVTPEALRCLSGRPVNDLVKNGCSDLAIAICFPENEMTLSISKEKYDRKTVKENIGRLFAKQPAGADHPLAEQALSSDQKEGKGRRTMRYRSIQSPRTICNLLLPLGVAAVFFVLAVCLKKIWLWPVFALALVYCGLLIFMNPKRYARALRTFCMTGEGISDRSVSILWEEVDCVSVEQGELPDMLWRKAAFLGRETSHGIYFISIRKGEQEVVCALSRKNCRMLEQFGGGKSPAVDRFLLAHRETK